MKKLLLVLGSFALALTVGAQTFSSRSFLNCQSLQVTNGISVTNLASITSGYTTNQNLTVFTNFASVRIATTNGWYDGQNLLRTVPLWVDRAGSAITPIYTNVTTALGSAVKQPGPFFGNIYIRVVGGTGANTATAFKFAPVPSDTGVDDSVAGDLITVSVTPNGATQVQSLTPLDAQKLIGCKGLMLVSITAGDTDASSQVVVLECTLNGFTP